MTLTRRERQFAASCARRVGWTFDKVRAHILAMTDAERRTFLNGSYEGDDQ